MEISRKKKQNESGLYVLRYVGFFLNDKLILEKYYKK